MPFFTIPIEPFIDPVTQDLSRGWRFLLIDLARWERAGEGSPEGVVKADIGTIYHRTDGGAGTSIYVKESGAGATGWIAK